MTEFAKRVLTEEEIEFLRHLEVGYPSALYGVDEDTLAQLSHLLEGEEPLVFLQSTRLVGLSEHGKKVLDATPLTSAETSLAEWVLKFLGEQGLTEDEIDALLDDDSDDDATLDRPTPQAELQDQIVAQASEIAKLREALANIAMQCYETRFIDYGMRLRAIRQIVGRLHIWDDAKPPES